MQSHPYVLSKYTTEKNKKLMQRMTTKIILVGEPDLGQHPEANKVEALKYR